MNIVNLNAAAGVVSDIPVYICDCGCGEPYYKPPESVVSDTQRELTGDE